MTAIGVKTRAENDNNNIAAVADKKYLLKRFQKLNKYKATNQ